MALLSFEDSAPRAYRLQVGNAYLTFSTSVGTSPGEDGIVVIQNLRSEYNDDIPAILLTGDTAPERLRTANESGFFVLHKPVDESGLHAAIDEVISAASSVES